MGTVRATDLGMMGTTRRGRARSRRITWVLTLAAAGVVVLAVTGSWPFRRHADPAGGAPAGETTSDVAPQTPPPASPPLLSAVTPAIPAPPPASVAATEPVAAAATVDDLARVQAELATLRKTADPDTFRRALGTRLVDPQYPEPVRRAWIDEARELSRRVVFSASPMKNAITVTVAPGENLTLIAARVKREKGVTITPECLKRINDVNPLQLRAKMPLKVPTEPLSIVIEKSNFRLLLLLGGVYLMDWPIGTGRDDKTPEGSFTISDKTRNPAWTDPATGKSYKFGEPGHLIGSRWMAFSDAHGKTGFGIHGTIEPESIGKALSAGCIRLRAADVEELFDLIPPGIPVVVRK